MTRTKKYLACLALLALAAGTCSLTGAPATGQARADQADVAASATAKSSAAQNVLTIEIPEETPVADENGEIPGADGAPAAERKTVTFGRYAQGKDGSEQPIEWLVLDEKDGYTLLLSKKILDTKGWVKSGRDDTTWAETDLCHWLAHDFYDAAFSADEKAQMALFHATQPQNPRYATPAGEATTEPVSLLSYQELIHYLPTDRERRTAPTAYAAAQGCYQNPEGDSAWWLRSPGPTPTLPEHLASWGNLGARAHYIDDASIGVRPVIWVKTSYLANKTEE